jgi:diadenosine tetraphosphate (Ap4A) HIT family hydrolase
MQIADRFRIYETDYWLINHRLDSALPGYLMLGSKLPISDLSDVPDDALATLGPLLAKAQRAMKSALHPDRIYIGRYGHSRGYPVHFHLIPVYDWVEALFRRDERYRVLQQFAETGGDVTPDGAELTLFIWREFCERINPPPIAGPAIDETIAMLRDEMTD